MAEFYESLKKLGLTGNEDWYFGVLTRDQSHKLLLPLPIGTYIIRSRMQLVEFALSIKDDAKVSHFKIMARVTDSGYQFVIGAQNYNSIQEIINYYSKNILSQSTLVEPAPRPKYKAMYKYEPDPDASEEIALNRYENVEYMGNYFSLGTQTVNESWWRVRRSTGQVGFVPANYLKQCQWLTDSSQQQSDTDLPRFSALLSLTVPFMVEAVRDRLPNIFDKAQLAMHAGDRIEVKQIKQELPEIWIGINKTAKAVHYSSEGEFPFNYVRWDDFAEQANEKTGSSGSNRTSQISASTIDEYERS